MVSRFFAFLMLVISAMNAFNGGALAEVSSSGEGRASVVQLNVVQAGAPASVLASAHDDSNCHNEGCTERHTGAHHCHVGHCQFALMASAASVTPDLIQGVVAARETSYLSIDLSGPRKPPRA